MISEHSACWIDAEVAVGKAVVALGLVAACQCKSLFYHLKLKRCLCLPCLKHRFPNSFSGIFGGNKKSKSKPSGSSYPKQEYKPATGTGVSGGSKSGGSSYPKQEYKPSGTSGGSRCGH